MPHLSVFSENGEGCVEVVAEFAAIEAALEKIGVQFERWWVNQPLAADADQEVVLQAYQVSIERLKAKYGFQLVDVVSLQPDHLQKNDFRAKFLSEHTHADFEVRFFVEGRGLFYLHVEDKVYMVLCEKGDLISVPANMTHWFDMGELPQFKCIRFFTQADGWVADFTGNEIAALFPNFDEYLATVV